MNDRIDKLLEQVKVNERIEALAEQAGCKIDRLGYGEGNLEKFAELIVRECVIRAEREWIRNGSDTEHNKAITGVINSIKEHFGVE